MPTLFKIVLISVSGEILSIFFSVTEDACNLEGGTPPKVDETKIKAIWDFLLKLYKRNLVKANHDVNKGCLIITIAEMCFKKNIGVDLDFSSSYNKNLRDDEFLFSESIGRFIIETDPNDYNTIIEISNQFDIEINKIGVVNSNRNIIVKGLRSQNFKLDIEKLKNVFDSTIPSLMEI